MTEQTNAELIAEARELLTEGGASWESDAADCLARLASALEAADQRADREPKVEIVREEGKPARCKVWRDGVLLFDGRDYSADLENREPSDAEVEAGARALALWDGEDWGTDIWEGQIPREAYRQGALRVLRAAQEVRRG